MCFAEIHMAEQILTCRHQPQVNVAFQFQEIPRKHQILDSKQPFRLFSDYTRLLCCKYETAAFTTARISILQRRMCNYFSINENRQL